MAFVAAMDQESANRCIGENGSLQFTTKGVGNACVALFSSLVRNLQDDHLAELWSHLTASDMTDVILLAFQTRDARGGKGEKSLFYKLFILIANKFPTTACELLSLIPTYGYYKDYFLLLEHIQSIAPTYANKTLETKIIDLVADQLLRDDALVETTPAAVSLLAKYAPRSKRHFSRGDNKATFKRLLSRLFPNDTRAEAKYRRMISRLTSALKVTEVSMCANEYDAINFKGVPSLCLNRNRKAFLNELVHKPPGPTQQYTGNRHPTDPSRVACRQHLLAATKTLKGKQVYPHEIVKALMGPMLMKSDGEKDVLHAQWETIRQTTIASMKESAIDLGNIVPLVDVSGSMEGLPMLVAISLGILVSEITAPAFRDRVLTFESNPRWIYLQGLDLSSKVQTVEAAPWGGNTDFAKALDLILDAATHAKLGPGDIPSLLVLSDMQFDNASPEFDETHLERMVDLFARRGRAVCGEPWNIPQIIFWNLRGDTNGYAAQSTTPGVRLLSGFSPALLRLFLSGKDSSSITPYETFRAAIDDARYDPVREVLRQTSEGLFADYL
jgi:Mg-chelatase subunit ChlD